MSEPCGPIPGVDSFIFAPSELGTALRISIAPPVARAPGLPKPELSPVVYVTDADFFFGGVAEAARIMASVGEIAPAYVVGIGYAEETGDYRFANVRRGLDFYRPPRSALDVPGMGKVALGGADIFLRVLIEQVLPEVEKRVSSIDATQRLLFGTSAGGHFATYALTRKPEAFAGYAMMSPNLRDWPPVPGEDGLLVDVADLAAGAIPSGVRVFLSAGDSEDDPGSPIAAASIIGNLYRLRALLAAQGVATALAVLPGENHYSVAGAAISRALRYLLAPRPPA